MPRIGGALDIVQVSDPATPVAGRQYLYFKSDGHLYTKTPAGAVVQVDGAIPADMATTDTVQSITAVKTFTVAPVVPAASFGVAAINATGVAGATTYLRGDGAWTAVTPTGAVLTGTSPTPHLDRGTVRPASPANGDLFVNEAVDLPQVPAIPWQLVYNTPSPVAGDWTSDGLATLTFGATLVDPGNASTGTMTRARLNPKFNLGAGVIYEADVRMTGPGASGSNGTDQKCGLIGGFDGSTSGGLIFRLHATSGTPDGVQIEEDSVGGRVSNTYNWGPFNTWRRMRIVASGGMASGYLDGVLQFTAGNRPAAKGDSTYLGIGVGGCGAEFRNFRVWTMALPT